MSVRRADVMRMYIHLHSRRKICTAVQNTRSQIESIHKPRCEKKDPCRIHSILNQRENHRIALSFSPIVRTDMPDGNSESHCYPLTLMSEKNGDYRGDYPTSGIAAQRKTAEINSLRPNVARSVSRFVRKKPSSLLRRAGESNLTLREMRSA